MTDLNIEVTYFENGGLHNTNKALEIADPTKANQPGYDYKGRRYVPVKLEPQPVCSKD